MKVCLITCYNQPNYIRTKTLRAALALIDDVEIVSVKNRRTGLLRYPEVLLKTLQARLAHNPDVYLLTFRGYEMLLPVRLISLGKRMIYDEFINPIEWVVHEQRQVEANQNSNKMYTRLISSVSKFIVTIVRSRIFRRFYRSLASSVDLVLADTDSHADISAKITGIPKSQIVGLPVSTEETVFKPGKGKKKNDEFTVFYYGNMLPLHGLKYVIMAASKMTNEPIKFVLIGGNAAVASDVAVAQESGANIEYHEWVEFDRLPTFMNSADLCLAGPFGNTFQAQYVVTGKSYQYMAMARPILIGKNEESHAFNDKKNALIVKQADAESLAEALRWAMKHQDKLPAIGLAGRKLYEERFSITVLSKKLNEILLRLDAK